MEIQEIQKQADELKKVIHEAVLKFIKTTGKIPEITFLVTESTDCGNLISAGAIIKIPIA